MSEIEEFTTNLEKKIKNAPENGTIVIHKFQKLDGDTEECRQQAEIMLNKWTKHLGRPDVKIVTKDSSTHVN